MTKPYNEDRQGLPPQHDLSAVEFIQPSLESARKYPDSNRFDPNQQPYVIDKTESEQQEEEEVREGENSKDEVDQIRKRLEDIKLASQEHILSQEQLKVNDRLQEEEVNIYLLTPNI